MGFSPSSRAFLVERPSTMERCACSAGFRPALALFNPPTHFPNPSRLASPTSLRGLSTLTLTLSSTSRPHCAKPISRSFSLSAVKFACLCTRNEGADTQERAPFGYTRKDVLLIGAAVTAFGVGLKYFLELFGVDSLKAGNVVQLVLVLGLTLGWVSTYLVRVASKDMTYAKQLRDYESKVMQKRLEELPEAELEALLASVQEEKTHLEQKEKLTN